VKPETLALLRRVLEDWRLLCEQRGFFPVALIVQDEATGRGCNMIVPETVDLPTLARYLRFAADQYEREGLGPVASFQRGDQQ